MRGRVLFSEPMGQYIRLDGVTVGEWPNGETPGSPFTLELALSETTWMADALVNVLADWADDGALVDVQFRPRSGGLVVDLHDGVSTVSLPLARHVV